MRGSRMRHMHHHHGPPRHRARRGAIKGSVLRLLAERPMHGYELIGELEERTGGRWRPSPGSVYPTLAQLEDEGLVRSFDDEGRKRFELTDAGRAWLDEHADEEQTPPWERSGVGRRGDLRRLGGEIFGAAPPARPLRLACPARAGPRDPRPHAHGALRRARRIPDATRRPTAVPHQTPRTPATSRTPDPGSVGRSRRDRGVERARAGRLREAHHPVVDGALAEHLAIALVALRVDPRLPVALLRHQVQHALDVTRREPLDPRAFGHVPI